MSFFIRSEAGKGCLYITFVGQLRKPECRLDVRPGVWVSDLLSRMKGRCF